MNCVVHICIYILIAKLLLVGFTGSLQNSVVPISSILNPILWMKWFFTLRNQTSSWPKQTCSMSIGVLLPMIIIWQRHFSNSKPRATQYYYVGAFAQCSTRGLSKSFQKSVSQLFMQLWLPSCCDGIQHNFSPLNSKSIEGSVPSRIMRSRERKNIMKHFGKSRHIQHT